MPRADTSTSGEGNWILGHPADLLPGEADDFYVEIDLSLSGWVTQGNLVAAAGTYTFEMTNEVAPTVADCVRLIPSTISTVADPTATPTSGEIYVDGLVELDCVTSGALIYYTLDGSPPRSSLDRQLYSAEINLPVGNSELRFYADKTDLISSATIVEYYTKLDVPSDDTPWIVSISPTQEVDGREIAIYCKRAGATEGAVWVHDIGVDPLTGTKQTISSWADELVIFILDAPSTGTYEITMGSVS